MKYPLRKQIEAQMKAEIQAEEDRRIYAVLDMLGLEHIHLLDRFIVDYPGPINRYWKLVSEYHPDSQRCSFRVVPNNPHSMGTVFSSQTKELCYVRSNGKIDWMIPPLRTAIQPHALTFPQQLCAAVGWAISTDSQGVDEAAAARYFEIERLNPFWKEFVDETDIQLLVASTMAS